VNSRKVAVVTLLGTVAFLSTGFLPSPIDKMVIGIQALCFSLAALLVPKGGATFASLIAGILLSVIRFWFFPFSLLFSVFYGVLIDGVFLSVNVSGLKASKVKFILLLIVATGIVGVVSMFLTTLMGVLPMIPLMYIAIIAFAIPNGAAAGYVTLMIWKRYLSHLSQ
jgi:hypothetical protein